MRREYWPTTEWQEAAPDAVAMDANKLERLNTTIQSQYTT